LDSLRKRRKQQQSGILKQVLIGWDNICYLKNYDRYLNFKQRANNKWQ
jgi:hypothetical protein